MKSRTPQSTRFSIIVLVLAFLAPAIHLSAESLDFDQLYSGSGVLGMQISTLTKGLAGKTVDFAGFMAPPLKAKGNFFVLTRNPVSLCPFCQSDADWPADIVVVYLKAEQIFVQRNHALVVTGRLELGSFTDPVTGFVSQIRIMDAVYRDK